VHGVNKNGHSVIFMPSQDARLTAADLGAVIAYIRSVPPVDRELPGIRLGPIARALINKKKGENVEVNTPGGAKAYAIKKIEWK